MTSVTVCYSDILKVHGMGPIRRTKWHALLTTVIFMHQVSSIGCIRSAWIVFQQNEITKPRNVGPGRLGVGRSEG